MFSKTAIGILFNLLQICPFVLPLVFAVLSNSSLNVLSSHFKLVSPNSLAVPTA